jgi:diguanylate cyclase (GGDEF)-like protein
MVLTACGTGEKTIPVVKGEVDSPDMDKAIRLDGEWLFFPGVYFDPGSGESAQQVPASIFLPVPGVWNSSNPFRGKGTYQVWIRNLVPGRLYAFQFKGVNSQADFWIDDALIGTWGAEGLDFTPHTFWFTPENDRACLTVAVENPTLAYGGIWMPVWFGTAASIEKATTRDRLLVFFVFGAIIMMGLYHLALFIYRSFDQSTLFFGLFCLLIALKSGVSGEQVLGVAFPVFSGSGGLRLSYIATILLPIVFILYLNIMFPRKRKGYILYGLAILGGVHAIVSLFFPLHIIQGWFLPYQISILLAGIYVAVVLAIEIARKAPGSVLMMGGFILIFVSVINDILHDNKIINTFYSLDLGLFFFLFNQALIMGKLYAGNFRQVQDLNATLESRVQDRTKALEELSRMDHLTGLINRRYFWTLLNQEWERWVRYGQEFCVVMVDLDHFKEINDTWGHSAGDDVLKTLSELLQGNVRKTDSISRYGGEEFCLILPGITAPAAFILMEKIRTTVESTPLLAKPVPVHRTFSFGIAQASRHESPDALLDAADKLMYQAKQAGRNRGFAES